MLRGFFYISAILILAFTVTAVGQDKKRVLSKSAKVKQAKKGVSEWTDILAVKNNKTKSKRTKARVSNPKPLATNLMKGHEGMQERNAPSGNRKVTKKSNNFTSTTQPFADGIVAKKRKSSKTLRKPTKPSNYTAGGTWVSGDPLTFNKTRKKTTSRKRPKKTQNLLPYMEQSNVYKKAKRKQN